MSLTALLSAAAALAGVVALIVLAGRLARRTGWARPVTGGRLRLEDSLALDRNRRLVLVSCDGRPVLLLTGPSDVVVGWVPPAP